MISTEKAFEILPYISDIYEKLDFTNFIEKHQNSKKEGEKKETKETKVGLDIFFFVLKQSGTVKEEFFNIVAIAEDKEVEEVRKQPFTETLKAIKELFADKELTDFFKSAMQ